MESTKSVRVLIVGAGAISKVHVQALAKLVAAVAEPGTDSSVQSPLSSVPRPQLVAVVDTVPERARALADYWLSLQRDGSLSSVPSTIMTAASLDQLVTGAKTEMSSATPAVADAAKVSDAANITDIADVALLAVPHVFHEPLAVQLLTAGLDVLVEKPLAISVRACDNILQAAAAHQRVVGVGHVQPYFPAVMAAARLLEQNCINGLVFALDRRFVDYFTAQRPRWFLDRQLSGGGIWFNLGAHSIDRLLQLVREPVIGVQAHLGFHAPPHVPPDIESDGLATLTFASGLQASIAISGLPGQTVNETELVGRRGRLRVVPENSLFITTGQQWETLDPMQILGKPALPPFTQLWADFLQAVAARRQPPVNGWYGRQVIEILEALYRSSETGHPVAIASNPSAPSPHTSLLR